MQGRLILLSLISPAFAVALYSGVLNHGFIWDDGIVLRHWLGAFTSVESLFFPPPDIPYFIPNYYRPLLFLSYLLDHALGQGKPFWFHFSVVLYHALNTLLLFFVAIAFFRGRQGCRWGALVAALLFAAHPIHTEAVAWMSGRVDVLPLFFLLASLLCYLSYRRRPRLALLLLTTLLFFFALLAKETAIALFFLLPALDLLVLRGERGGGPAWTRYTPFAFTAGVYFLLRRAAIGAFVGGKELGIPLTQQGERLLLALVFYMEKTLLPIHLNAFVADIPGGWLRLSLSLVAVTILACVFLRWCRRGERVAPFLLLWFFVTLVPSLAVAVWWLSSGAPVAERYLYIPSAGFTLLLAYGLLLVAEKGQRAGCDRLAAGGIGLFVLILLTLYVAGTVQRNRVWANGLTFWQDTAAKAPNHGLPHLNLGLAYYERGMAREAEHEYWTALTLKSDDYGRALTYNGLGALYIQQSRCDEAEEYLRKALAIYPRYPTPYLNLASCVFMQAHEMRGKKQPEEERQHLLAARGLLEQALKLDPRYTLAHELLGRVAWLLGDKETARRHFSILMQIDPLSEEARRTQSLLATLQ